MDLLRGTPCHGLLLPRTCGHELALETGLRAVAASGVRGLSHSPRENKASPPEWKWGQQQSARRGGPELREVAGAGLCLSRRHRGRPLTEVSLSKSRTGQAADLGGSKVAGESRSREVSLPPPCPALVFRDIHC